MNSVSKGESEDIDLTMVDIVKCFDKLWLQDTIIDLYDANLKNDNLVLLYKLNEKNSIAVKTSQDLTERFIVNDAIMQGTIFGSLQCTTSLSKIGAEAYKQGEPLLIYKDTIQIPPLGMVDDLLTMNKCGTDSIKANTIVNSFMESKKLELGTSKCHRIHIGKDKSNCPDLKVHKEKMKNSNCEKYIGDLISETCKNGENISSRKAKAFGIAGDILAILEEMPLGPLKIQARLCMREGMLINGILTNSEVWYGLKENDYTDL